MYNRNWPTLDKSFEAAGQAPDGTWYTHNGATYIDGFTDVGGAPISNYTLTQWMREGEEAGALYRVPHVIGHALRDDLYPAAIGAELGMENPTVFYNSGGSEAVETAIKLARLSTGRQWVISYAGDFHGRSLANLSLETAPAYHRKGFGPFVPKMGEALLSQESPDCVQLQAGTEGDFGFGRTIRNEDVAAVVISPILGNNTLKLWPSSVWEQVERLQAAGALVIFDEVQTGFGRAGGVISVTQSPVWELIGTNVKPDIYVFGKAAGAGWPHAPVFCRGELSSVMTPGTHFNTMAGSPMGCYLSLRMRNWLRDGGLRQMVDNADYLSARFESIYNYGYMMGIRVDEPYEFVRRAMDVGLLLMTARPDEPIRLSPLFEMTVAQAEELGDKLEAAGLV